jgi:predicted AlkP superfamily pyrophosphatase or phosphodiesterase
MATGLYAEGHGIVGNNIYDPGFKQSFGMGKSEEVRNGRWWLGEPIWVTAEKQGRRTGAFFFPGTEAEIGGRRPSYWKPYDEKVPNSERIATVLSWLDLPAAQRPALILTYFSDVDDAGHEAGPDSDVVGRAVSEVDRALGELVGGLQSRGLSDQVNLIVVSDHGMAALAPDHAIALDDFFNSGLAEAVSWNGELVNIFPKPGMKDAIYSSLKSHAPPHVKIYSREEIPARLHYSMSPRIGEIVVMADEGWLVVSRGRQRLQGMAAAVGGRNRGAHGYDNQLESMRALFIARGPAFKRAELVDPIKNVDVYNVIANILGLEPARNEGDAATARAVLR